MIARPEDIPASGSSSPDLSGAETPLQRQIILWQRELLRRAERTLLEAGILVAHAASNAPKQVSGG